MVGSSFHLATMHAGDCEGLHDRSVEVDTPFLFFFPAPHCSHAPCVVLPSTDVHPHHGCIFQARVWHAILIWTRATMDAMGTCVVFSQPRDPWICSVSLFLSCFILVSMSCIHTCVSRLVGWKRTSITSTDVPLHTHGIVVAHERRRQLDDTCTSYVVRTTRMASTRSHVATTSTHVEDEEEEDAVERILDLR